VFTGEKVTLVESGPTSSVPRLVEGLKELGIKFEDIKYVAVTHVHLDHGGGAGTLIKYLPNAKVIVHPKGMPHLVIQSGFGSQHRRFWALSPKFLESLNPFRNNA